MKSIERLNRQQATHKMNEYGSHRRPFLFVIDYAMRSCIIQPLETVDPAQLSYVIGGQANTAIRPDSAPTEPLRWDVSACSEAEYHHSFDTVIRHLQAGNTYLTNLTCATPVSCNLSLREIFDLTQAPYKLYLADQFVSFSPETFVQIAPDGTISSFPMKGTIRASVPEAASLILRDAKEAAEHATIVDLIRNDLSRVAQDVQVERYRYIDRISTHDGELLQVSSEVRGRLPQEWQGRVGDILFELLPPGSVTGAPKPKTQEIIAQAETYDRGYYTGVFGLFDGQRLDSGVLIRFLEHPAGAGEGEYLFKSGGGITAQSDPHSEYEEMKTKIYVPLRRDH